jgi:hypothetical protein
MSPTADSATAEDQLADRVIVSIKAALAGNPQPFAALAQENSAQPAVVALIAATACSALFAHVAALKDAGGGLLGKWLATAHASAAALDTLERQVAELEQAVGPEYCGTFEQGKTYARGQLCTRSGGLWLAVAETSAPPTASSPAWQLVVRRGEGG